AMRRWVPASSRSCPPTASETLSVGTRLSRAGAIRHSRPCLYAAYADRASASWRLRPRKERFQKGSPSGASPASAARGGAAVPPANRFSLRACGQRMSNGPCFRDASTAHPPHESGRTQERHRVRLAVTHSSNSQRETPVWARVTTSSGVGEGDDFFTISVTTEALGIGATVGGVF